MANKVLGMHRLKNKVNRNAFDLTHRHMFTAQVGELLPVFSQWVNPNETFKIGYNGKTRTAALNTDAFTRIRENIQYYFVPFQSLWKYFEQQINNMTQGDAGQNISKFAKSSTEASSLSINMPYISYIDLGRCLELMYKHAKQAISDYIGKNSIDYLSAEGFKNFCVSSSTYADVFVCDGYRLCRAAKLLMSLGYGNFSNIVQYDIFAMAFEFLKTSASGWSDTGFQASGFGLRFDVSIRNSPNLSIFPLLAYHKICNDHYRNEKWQPFEPWTCNIDYLTPGDNMNAMNFIKSSTFTSLMTSILDLENSNLPIDYFTSVLPRAQYGDEAAVPVGSNSSDAFLRIYTGHPDEYGPLWVKSKNAAQDNLIRENTPGNAEIIGSEKFYHNDIMTSASNDHLVGFKGSLTTDTSLRISALRSATALQKYKEIQNSNDPDFAAQVLAHFGIKPKVDSRTSVFIGGDDKTLSINPQVNTNFANGGEPEIKAIGIGDLSAGCKFTSTTYGMIIGIYRAIPQLDYSRVGVDRNLFKTDATDFPIPEFDSIGMQTQYRCELSAFLVGICDKINTPPSPRSVIDMSVTYGYAPRYAELKSSCDYFEGGFMGAYSSWVTGYDSSFLRKWRINENVHSGSELPGIDDLFKCRPSLLYPIFVNQWSGTVNDDKLLIGSVNTCVAVRPFSMYGLPYSR